MSWSRTTLLLSVGVESQEKQLHDIFQPVEKNTWNISSVFVKEQSVTAVILSDRGPWKPTTKTLWPNRPCRLKMLREIRQSCAVTQYSAGLEQNVQMIVVVGIILMQTFLFQQLSYIIWALLLVFSFKLLTVQYWTLFLCKQGLLVTESKHSSLKEDNENTIDNTRKPITQRGQCSIKNDPQMLCTSHLFNTICSMIQLYFF